MKVFSWNARGLENCVKRASMKEVIRENKPNLAFFQEIKLSSLNSIIINELWSRGSMDWVCLHTDGSSRGILIVWNSRSIMKKDVWVGSFSVWKTWIINLVGLLLQSMEQMMEGCMDFYGMNLTPFVIDGTGHGASG